MSNTLRTFGTFADATRLGGKPQRASHHHLAMTEWTECLHP